MLGVPFLGDPRVAGGGDRAPPARLAGFGLLISVVSDSERQAVQLSLLVLLASVFFSGFVLRSRQFAAPVQVLGNLLPVTQGIRLMQDVLLRGETTDLWRLGVMAGVGAVTLAITWLVLRRGMSALA